MVSIHGKGSAGQALAHAQAVLRVLAKKPFFQHRFQDQVRALYADTGTVSDLAPSLYLSALFTRLPDEARAASATLAAARIVNDYQECPSPAEVRSIIVDSVVSALGLTYAGLAERARLFVAQPPQSQDIADRWLERVLYTTIARIGFESFSNIAIADWQRELGVTMLSEPEAISSYQVRVERPPKVERRDFKTLLPNHG
ncbi:hypothetical protein [Ralstonia sp. ASV6]|uniref:hypothetical protein n=1 Tax=Ralstonia sp. ASV6 TaxID=2795124 RepID=UPI0018EE1D05|nr:hypothetical protein [Ralstonia sp. ASV6]